MGGWYRLVFISVLCVLSACGGRPSTPEFEEVPTVFRFPTRTLIPTLTPSPTPIDTPTATPTDPPPTATPVPMAQIVIAVKPIPAGMAIPPEALRLNAWPENSLPNEVMTDVNAVVNQVALVDIVCFEPILPGMIAPRTIGSGFEPLPGDCGVPPIITPTLSLTGVAIARQYIPIGTTITPDMIVMRAWPVALLPPGAIQAAGSVIGRTTRQDILREQPILTSRITSGN